MAPPAFDDFAGSNNSLFDDHHSSGNLSYKHKGKVASGADYELSASAAHGAANVDWELATNMNGLDVKFDSSNTISKALSLNIKQVEGLTLNWESSFNAASGLDLGNVNANFSNDKLNFNLKSTIDAAPAIDFNAVTNVKDVSVGVKGSFDVKTSALGAIGWGLHAQKGNVQLSFVNENINTPMSGMLHVYQALPDNKNFCCYGVQANTATGEMSFGAADTCCDKNTMRYKLDHNGTLQVAKVQKLSQKMALNVSASLNLKDLSAGGHVFGAGLSFE